MIALIICFRAGGLAAQTTEVASDNFDRPDGPIGTNWLSPIASEGTFYITNDTVTSIPVDEHVEAYWSSNSFSPDQYSQARLSSIGPFSGVILRADNDYDPVFTNPPSGSQFYMGFVFAPNDYRIYHWVNNAYFPEIYGTEQTWETNDIIKLVVSGSTEPLVTMYRNGNPVLMWLVTDAGDVKTNGNPGLCMYSRDTDPLTIADWEGGNLNPDTNAPSVPADLTATAVAPNEINLSWMSSTDDVGVAGYLLERSQGAGSTNFILIYTPTDTNYFDTGAATRYNMFVAAPLAPGTTYNYRLRATDAAGNFSGYSQVVTATTPIPPLPTVSPIPDQTTLVGISVGPFPFYITDPGVDPSSLTATAASSNTNLVPNENLNIFNVNGSTQALTITPADGQTGTSVITISVNNGVNGTNVSFLLTVNPPGNGNDLFSNPSSITIPSSSVSTPYPSTIDVSGEVGTITNLMVTLNGMSHTYPGDVNVLLVGPGGQTVVLMSDTVGSIPMTNVTFTLSDQAYYPLPPPSYALLDGTFQPTDLAPNHTDPPYAFPAPAPTPPYTTSLATFDGLSPNGTWSLYISDGGTDDGGQISGGWSLAITTVSPPTISGLTNQSTPVNTPTAAIPFEIGDAQTPGSNLVLTATSSDPTVINVATDIVFGGSDTNRSITLTPEPNNIGTTTISVIVTDSDGMSATNSFLMTVNPGQLSVTGITASDKIYDGTTSATLNTSAANLTGQGLAGSDVTLNTSSVSGAFLDPNAGANKTVQISGLTLNGTDAGNYILSQPVGLVANITGKGVTISSGLSANNKVYDGTTVATLTSNSVVLAGVLAGDSGNVSLVTNGYAANFASAGVGTGIGVTVSGLTLGGSAAGNYILSQPVGLVANITPKVLTIGSATPSPVITSIGLTNGVVSIMWNSVTGGIYRVQYNNSLNGGGWTDLSPDVTATNSTATQTNAVGSAPQRFYRIKLLNAGLTANDKVYDGTTVATLSSNNVILVGVVNGDSVSLVTNGYTANFATPNVGTGISVTVSGLTLSGASAGNYTLIQPTGLTANITGKGVTINSVPSPFITSIGLTNGVVSIVWNSVTGGVYRVQYNNSLNGGGWTDLSPDVTATGTTANQTNVVSGTPLRFYRIKVLNPGITANNKVYDGTTIATINSNNVIMAGVLGGDTVSLSTNGYTANFATANAGTNIPVTVTGLTLTGANAADYTLAPLTGLTANISPANLVVSAVNQNKTYGLSNPPLSVNYSGFVGSDGTNVLSGAPGVSTIATNNSPPGSYPITVGAGTLSAANYNFSFVNGILTVFAPPQLNSVALTGGQVAVAWPSVTGQTYQLAYKDNLAAPTWTLIPGSIPGTGGSIVMTNNLGASPQRFFKLVINNP